MTRTYATMTFDTGRRAWVINNLAPHVAIAFKRLFPRIPKTATLITLADSDDIRADLAWFMSRYPFDHNEHSRIAQGAQRIADRLAERDRILLPTWTPADCTGFQEGKAPYVYQSQAAAIAVANGGLLLGDEVGLGKTISALAALVGGAPLPAAIVVQPHLARQWARSVMTFTTLRVHVIRSTTPYNLPPADVYIFKYSNLAGWSDVLAKRPFASVVYDEVQELRHGLDSQKGRAAAIMSAAADFRMGLTATPVYNYGDEMFTVMSYVQPDLLGTREEFLREWCGSGIRVQDPDALGSYLRESGYFLRRTEDDETVNASMPPPNILDWEVDYDSDAVADEEALTRMLAMKVMNGSFVEAGQAARELDLKMRMLTGIAKARAVAAYVKLLLRDTERVLLAGWHREVYGIWQTELAAFNPVLYTGSETAAGKDRSVKEFTEGKSRVMMISLRSGVGLDGLQHNCNDVVFGELDWSPQVHHQIIGRLRRPGQTRQVNGHYVHANGGSDPVLIETLGIKSDQARGINDPGVAPKVRCSDDSRIRKLAEYVLGDALVDA